mmetsp:Transcript_26284/g.43930  ORF Transcript_26284/g.43930 Transcript_26284/m.43930 type:complete len:311 (-) Transcript_26284:208-1140(-)
MLALRSFWRSSIFLVSVAIRSFHSLRLFSFFFSFFLRDFLSFVGSSLIFSPLALAKAFCSLIWASSSLPEEDFLSSSIFCFSASAFLSWSNLEGLRLRKSGAVDPSGAVTKVPNSRLVSLSRGAGCERLMSFCSFLASSRMALVSWDFLKVSVARLEGSDLCWKVATSPSERAFWICLRAASSCLIFCLRSTVSARFFSRLSIFCRFFGGALATSTSSADRFSLSRAIFCRSLSLGSSMLFSFSSISVIFEPFLPYALVSFLSTFSKYSWSSASTSDRFLLSLFEFVSLNSGSNFSVSFESLLCLNLGVV